MKKQQKQLIGILVVLVLCIAAYFAVSRYAKMEQEKEKESETQAQVTVVEIDVDQVDAFSYNYDGVTYTYQKSGDEWSCQNDTSLKMDTGSIENLLGNLEKVTAEEKLEEYDSLSDYGLDEPQDRIAVTCGDDTITLCIGDYNDMLGEYYLRMEGDDSVYLITSAIPNAFKKQPDSLALEESETQAEEQSETQSE